MIGREKKIATSPAMAKRMRTASEHVDQSCDKSTDQWVVDLTTYFTSVGNINIVVKDSICERNENVLLKLSNVETLLKTFAESYKTCLFKVIDQYCYYCVNFSDIDEH